MPDARLTDERLKSHLNGRQADRERMCLAILNLDKSYSQIEPRRPEGGPDGGRDLQCFRNGMKCFAAVGFKNNANDSPQQIREIRQKFIADLQSALASDSTIKSFVFFTNVDLTPSVQEELQEHARNRGITFVDILYRERLRVILDTVEGYAIRLSYLDISLTDEEQKVFFNRFGREIQDAIAGRLDSVEHRMEEILYRNWLRGDCRNIVVFVNLKRWYKIEGTAHEPYRFAVRLSQVRTTGDGEIVLGCYSKLDNDGSRTDYATYTYHYFRTSLVDKGREVRRDFGPGTRALYQPFHQISFGAHFRQQGSLVGEYGIPVNGFGGYVWTLFCDLAWVDKIKSVEVWLDDYLMYDVKDDALQLGYGSTSSVIPYWSTEPDALSERLCQQWELFWPEFDRVPKRKRIGEN